MAELRRGKERPCPAQKRLRIEYRLAAGRLDPESMGARRGTGTKGSEWV